MPCWALADWRGPASITKENQQEHGISVGVYEDEKQNRYVVEMKPLEGKCCWIFPKGEPSEGFGNVIYSPKDRFEKNRMGFKESEKLICVVDKPSIKTARILLDHCGAILDGGYYYVIDLSTYVE